MSENNSSSDTVLSFSTGNDDSQPQMPSSKKQKKEQHDGAERVEVANSIKAATKALQSLTSKSAADNELPADIKGFLISLGADLASINNTYTRKSLLLDIQKMVFEKLFVAPAQPETNFTPIFQMVNFHILVF